MTYAPPPTIASRVLHVLEQTDQYLTAEQIMAQVWTAQERPTSAKYLLRKAILRLREMDHDIETQLGRASKGYRLNRRSAP